MSPCVWHHKILCCGSLIRAFRKALTWLCEAGKNVCLSPLLVFFAWKRGTAWREPIWCRSSPLIKNHDFSRFWTTRRSSMFKMLLSAYREWQEEGLVSPYPPLYIQINLYLNIGTYLALVSSQEYFEKACETGWRRCVLWKEKVASKGHWGESISEEQ